jgi:multidrug efflux pump subunit AcrA (membrane-fusion protein)
VFHKYILPVLSVFGLAFAILYVEKNRTATTPSQSPVSQPRRPSKTVLAGSGIVEPRTQNISVGSPVPGIVVWVIDTERLDTPVAVGEVLFRLDDLQRRAELAVSKVALESARRQLERLKQMPREEEVEPLLARVAEAKVRVADEEDQLGRAQRLYKTRALSLEEYRHRLFAYETAKQQQRKAEADLQLVKRGAWSADLAVSQLAVQQAEAQVKQVETELERLDVKALVAGRLLQINIRPGEFASSVPGQNHVILGDVDNLHVRVDIDEDDAPQFRPDAPATAYLRSQEQYAYPLEFVRVEPYIVPKKSMTRENTERVDTRVLQIIYKLKNAPDPRHRVYVGQQMDVFLDSPPARPAKK